MASDPNTTFSYSTQVSLALGALVEQERETGYQIYANKNLIEPLQITRYLWNELKPTGRTPAGSGLYLTTRDMTKLGQLFLDGGTWNGTRTVSESWIRASSSRQASLPDAQYPNGYGYRLWTYDLADLEALAAVGFGGQYVLIIPEKI